MTIDLVNNQNKEAETNILETWMFQLQYCLYREAKEERISHIKLIQADNIQLSLEISAAHIRSIRSEFVIQQSKH